MYLYGDEDFIFDETKGRDAKEVDFLGEVSSWRSDLQANYR